MKTANTLRNALLAASFVLLAGGASGSRAQQSDAPQVENAQVQTRSVSGTLAATMTELEKSATSALWVGYAVNAVAGQRTICCGNYNDGENCRKCALEIRDAQNAVNTKTEVSKSVALLEGGQRLAVLFRVQDKKL